MENNYNELEEIHCSSCGAKLFTYKNTMITRCVYCNSQQLIKKQYNTDFYPTKIVPFKITKEEFIKIYNDSLSKNQYVPEEVKVNSTLNDIRGLYVPYFFANYNIRVYADGTSETGANHNWINAFKMDFSEKALASIDASLNLDDSIMESLKPYYYQDIVDFNPMYLAGFQSEFPSDSRERMESRLNTRIIRYCCKCVNKGMPFYIHRSGNEIYDFYKTSEFECVLLPVWLVSIIYEGNRYSFLVNGQTGKVVGNFPVKSDVYKLDEKYKKKIKYCWIFFIISLVLVITFHASLVFLAMIYYYEDCRNKLKSSINTATNIKHLYDIPISSWDRVYRIKPPGRNPLYVDMSFRVGPPQFIRRPAVRCQRFENGIFVENINVNEITKWVNSIDNTIGITKNNNNL